jgi:hypothetical protein
MPEIDVAGDVAQRLFHTQNPHPYAPPRGEARARARPRVGRVGHRPAVLIGLRRKVQERPEPATLYSCPHVSTEVHGAE